MSKIIDKIEIYDESEGLIVSGKALDSTIPTTASRFAPGASILGVDGKNYVNSGTTAVPVWQDSGEIVTSEIAAQAITMPKIVRGTDGQIIIAATGADSKYAVLSGDVTMDKDGAVTIGGSKVGTTELEANMDFTGSVLAKISIPAGTPVNSVAAQGTMTLSGGVPSADETFVIDTMTFTFKALRAVPGEVTIGADEAATVINIVDAITADNAMVGAADGAGDTVIITAETAGIGGNSIVFTENASNLTVNGTGTLGATRAGVNATVGSAREMYADANYLYYTNTAVSTAGNGWRRISLGSVY